MIKTVIFSLLLVTAVVLVFLPKILNVIGLHPYYKGKGYNLAGKKTLIITTSHDKLGTNGKKTGVYASEMTVPYYVFSDANVSVSIASIKGGEIPIEPGSLKYPLLTSSDMKFLNDEKFKVKVKESLKIDDINFLDYGLIYMAGGWGASYDLGFSVVLGEKITLANAAGIILGSVCHGALGFLKSKEVDGEPLVKGKNITAVTDKQVRELRIISTPMHPETELRKAGANYLSETAFSDIFANLTVVDGNIVTGQNQNSGSETAQTMLKLLKESIK